MSALSLSPRALYEEVAELLRQRIFARELPPGSWIDELKIAEAYGISRIRTPQGRVIYQRSARADGAVQAISNPFLYYQNQMLRGISNIVTTRSDVFTIWLRIRTIKQDTLTGQWNGTDPESIVDDSRYMMTIDRSSVDRPGEQPRIVSFVKVPN